MKLINLYNWLSKNGLNKEASDLSDLLEPDTLNDIIVLNKASPPISGNLFLDETVKDILLNLDVKDLNPEYKRMHRSGECNPLTGFCRVTTETLWEAVSRLEDSGFNYKPCRVVHGGGPHYFLRDTDNGHIIDLTAGQFEDPVPYDTAVCDTDEKRSASKGWAHKRRVRDSAALPGYDMGRGARNTLDRISRSKDETL